MVVPSWNHMFSRVQATQEVSPGGLPRAPGQTVPSYYTTGAE